MAEPASMPDTPPGSPAEPGDFRIAAPGEVLALLRHLQQQQATIELSSAAGLHLSGQLCGVDAEQAALSFDVGVHAPQLPALLEADEVTAVAYLDQIRLQFELEGLLLVNGAEGAVLRSALPLALYRFQRRQTFRVRPNSRTPQARLQHPLWPEPQRLRVLDLSIGGLALLLPPELPAPPPGCLLSGAQIELDRETRFGAGLRLQHVHVNDGGGTQLGLAFAQIEAAATRDLQRYIDQTQKLSRLLRKP